MRTRLSAWLGAIATCVLIVGCATGRSGTGFVGGGGGGGTDTAANGADTSNGGGLNDASSSGSSDDAGTADVALTDAAVGLQDTGSVDVGPADTGPEDTGPVDTGPPDIGPPDTGPKDVKPFDGGPPDTGPKDTSGGVATTKTLLQQVHSSVNYASCKAFGVGQKGVTVKDLVIATPRRYVTKTLDGVYAHSSTIQGSFSGLYIVGSANSFIAKMQPGDIVTVTGDNRSFYCSQQLNGALFTTTGTGAANALVVTLSDIGENATLQGNQARENRLITVNNLVVADLKGDKANYGNLFVGTNAGDKALIVTIVRDAGWDSSLASYSFTTKKWTYKVAPGVKIASLTGVLSFSFGHWRLHPTKVAFAP